MKFIYKSVSLKVGVRAYAGFPGGSMVKNPPANAGDTSLISGLGSSPGGGNGNPLQYSCLESSTDGGAWQATVHGVAKSRAQLSDFTYLLTYLVECKQMEELTAVMWYLIFLPQSHSFSFP